MEPKLIDYYNEMPYCVNVIEKMNGEFSDLQKDYQELQKKYNDLKIKDKEPTITANSIKERKSIGKLSLTTSKFK